MNANKTTLPALCLTLLLAAGPTWAVQGLESSGQSKVNNALAKRWSEQDKAQQQAKSGYQRLDDKRVVNVGNSRQNNCNVNVGTAQPGQRAPKDIVVTTKEVINVCK